MYRHCKHLSDRKMNQLSSCPSRVICSTTHLARHRQEDVKAVSYQPRLSDVSSAETENESQTLQITHSIHIYTFVSKFVANKLIEYES